MYMYLIAELTHANFTNNHTYIGAQDAWLNAPP